MTERFKLTKDTAKIIDALHSLVQPVSTCDLSKRVGMPETTLMAHLENLKIAGCVTLSGRRHLKLQLSDEGSLYAEKELPERRLVELLAQHPDGLSLHEAEHRLGTGAQQFNVALGWARRKGWARVAKRGEQALIQAAGIPERGTDEVMLRRSSETARLDADFLSQAEYSSLEELQKRNLLSFSQATEWQVQLSETGEQLAKKGYELSEEIGKPTSDLIRTGQWRQTTFKKYDVSAEPQPVYPGRRHPYLDFLDEVRQILVGMGFEEAEGPYIETEFWNFDALFQAQDHPAREIHDSYSIKHPKRGDLPASNYVENVRQVHEDGWRYAWNADIARRLVLRTQTTAVSMRHLYTHREPPVKMFCISRNFRPDILDATHSMEFCQCEGIAMDGGLTFRHLLGLLKEFCQRLGLGQVKFRPSYFPFTEPSVEGFVRHPVLGWVEMLPGGLFRPEVLKPLGIKHPVLAWGIGIDRIAMIALGFDDIRELFTKDLQTLRTKELGWFLRHQ